MKKIFILSLIILSGCVEPSFRFIHTKAKVSEQGICIEDECSYKIKTELGENDFINIRSPASVGQTVYKICRSKKNKIYNCGWYVENDLRYINLEEKPSSISSVR